MFNQNEYWEDYGILKLEARYSVRVLKLQASLTFKHYEVEKYKNSIAKPSAEYENVFPPSFKSKSVTPVPDLVSPKTKGKPMVQTKVNIKNNHTDKLADLVSITIEDTDFTENSRLVSGRTEVRDQLDECSDKKVSVIGSRDETDKKNVEPKHTAKEKNVLIQRITNIDGILSNLVEQDKSRDKDRFKSLAHLLATSKNKASSDEKKSTTKKDPTTLIRVASVNNDEIGLLKQLESLVYDSKKNTLKSKQISELSINSAIIENFNESFNKINTLYTSELTDWVTGVRSLSEASKKCESLFGRRISAKRLAKMMLKNKYLEKDPLSQKAKLFEYDMLILDMRLSELSCLLKIKNSITIEIFDKAIQKKNIYLGTFSSMCSILESNIKKMNKKNVKVVFYGDHIQSVSFHLSALCRLFSGKIDAFSLDCAIEEFSIQYPALVEGEASPFIKEVENCEKSKAMPLAEFTGNALDTCIAGNQETIQNLFCGMPGWLINRYNEYTYSAYGTDENTTGRLILKTAGIYDKLRALLVFRSEEFVNISDSTRSLSYLLEREFDFAEKIKNHITTENVCSLPYKRSIIDIEDESRLLNPFFLRFANFQRYIISQVPDTASILEFLNLIFKYKTKLVLFLGNCHKESPNLSIPLPKVLGKWHHFESDTTSKRRLYSVILNVDTSDIIFESIKIKHITIKGYSTQKDVKTTHLTMLEYLNWEDKITLKDIPALARLVEITNFENHNREYPGKRNDLLVSGPDVLGVVGTFCLIHTSLDVVESRGIRVKKCGDMVENIFLSFRRQHGGLVSTANQFLSAYACIIYRCLKKNKIPALDIIHFNPQSYKRFRRFNELMLNLAPPYSTATAFLANAIKMLADISCERFHEFMDMVIVHNSDNAEKEKVGIYITDADVLLSNPGLKQSFKMHYHYLVGKKFIQNALLVMFKDNIEVTEPALNPKALEGIYVLQLLKVLTRSLAAYVDSDSTAEALNELIYFLKDNKGRIKSRGRTLRCIVDGFISFQENDIGNLPV
ncbi:hypothetical protein AX774_g1541 [Zancudomyces culisetae]|uniref:Tyrosine-protein phosphatase domain-containing protein n=1 Tax=Zancudomyces culisetae TaxID=1213189 RepID=A0A1R1PVF4_ZANCU|nr:hypothetical protein AX774_g1541 [Zancudomyces culisetae]|eukprot:OMH84928.1 hypothetical protein AX774_g1541 [Zancudomyces culisetae]